VKARRFIGREASRLVAPDLEAYAVARPVRVEAQPGEGLLHGLAAEQDGAVDLGSEQLDLHALE
jgi:hypothetical protein